MAKKQSKEFLEINSHFATDYSEEIRNYVTDRVLLLSRYIFTKRVASIQFGHCTHCKKNFPSGGLKHNQNADCPGCKSQCIVKASGVGRKYLIDRAYIVYYEKSLIDPQAVVARGFSVKRDYTKDYLKVETEYTPNVMYVFKMGGSQMFWRSYWGNEWQAEKTVKSIYSNSEHANDWCSYESIRAAIKGTPFHYSTWEHYRDNDMVKFFDLYSRYPCIEYLTKLGMGEIVEAKLYNRKTYNVVNWRATNPVKVLKMTKQEMSDVLASKVTIDPWLLYLRRIAKNDGSHFSIAEVARIANELEEYDNPELTRILKRTTLRKVDWYLTKQKAKPDVNERYHRKRDILNAWDDYLADAAKLGLDFSREAVLFPANLYRAHQNTIKQIRVNADKALRAKIAAQVKRLSKLCFEAMGFILRPAADTKELIEEGKQLQHCVGTYADRYAKGEIDLFVIRKIDEPDKPFYTMEIRSGVIRQCRGLKNCDMTPEVKAFVDRFKAEKLEKKRARVKVTAQQEVAV